MGIHEPLDAQMEHANLRLNALPDIDQVGQVIDQLPFSKDRDQQILECGFWSHMFAPGRILRINNREWGRSAGFFVKNAIADKLLFGTETPNLLNSGV